MATNKQNIRQFIGRVTTTISPSKKKRIEMSIRRLVLDYIYQRTLDNKDWGGKPLPAYKPSYATFKAKLLSGRIKGRGGRASKTLARFKRRKARVKTAFGATSVNDKVRLSGLLLSNIDIPKDSIKLIQARGSNRLITTFQVNVPSEFDGQAKGLFKRRFRILGFQNGVIPKDLNAKIQQSITRILND